jgi:hypothetical protein
MTNPRYHIVESPWDVVTLIGPGAIRWATGHPDGPRSLTWTVIGGRNSDNVYVAARGLMGAAKLSLHESGVWRFAFTEQGMEKVGLPEGEDRVIDRYEATTELAPGWVHAARIRTPSTTFSSTISEHRPSDKQPIRFYKTPDLPHHLEYHVVLGDSAAEDAIVPVTEAITVGRMTLTSGMRVLIIAGFWQMDGQSQQAIDFALENAAKGAPGNTGFISGNADGVATFLDLATVKPPE